MGLLFPPHSNRAHVFIALIVLLLQWQQVDAFIIASPQAAVDALNITFRPILGLGLSTPIPTEGIEASLYIPSNSAILGCISGPSLEPAVKGRIALIGRGGCSFVEKAAVVSAAGAVAMIVYNNQGSLLSDTLVMNGNGTTFGIVCESITQVEGKELQYLASQYGNLTLRIFQEPTNPTQKQALRDLYNATGGPSWSYSTVLFHDWEANTDPCQAAWKAVTCSPQGFVIALNLGISGLTGQLPSSFYTLTTLSILSLGGNKLSGTLPEYISTFTGMQELSLSRNNFTGTIPNSYTNLKQLLSLDLSNNRLTGTIPNGFWSLTTLNYLVLSDNALTGNLPPAIPLPNLQKLSLENNQLTGDLGKVDVVNLTNLIELTIGNNRFGGELPASFGNLSRLSTLDVGGCGLSGTIPLQYAGLTNLRYFNISGNKYTGEIPDAPLPSQLRTFLAASNFFTSVSAGFVIHTSLVSVDFSHNLIASSAIEAMAKLPVPANPTEINKGNCLQYIDLSYNQLWIQESTFQLLVNKWPLLVSIQMQHNNLSKGLDVISYNNPYLKIVDVSYNNLTGTLPSLFSQFVGLTELNFLRNSFRHVVSDDGNLLPPGYVANYDISKYYPSINANCPTILLQPEGITVLVDPEYHSYALCQCEPGYRRINLTYDVPSGKPQFQCKICPSGMTCPGRNNDTEYYIHAGFFPTPSIDDPEELLPCPHCNPDNNEEFTCATHHQGRLCSQCVPGAFLHGSSCEVCTPIGSVFFVISVIALVVIAIGFASFAVWQRFFHNCFQRQRTRMQITVSEDALFSQASPTKEKRILPQETSMAALLIAINYYQTVSALSQYYQLPVSISEIISVVKIFTSVSGAGIGIECLHPSLQEYSNKYLAIMLEPPFLLSFILLVYLIGKLYITLTKSVPTILHEWGITCSKLALFVLNLLFFPVTTVAINAFRCTPDPVTNISYISQYPYERCDAISLAGRILALLVYTLGTFSLFSYLILQYKLKSIGHINPPGTLAYFISQSFGFFFLHFRDKYLFFAIAVLVRRLAISFTSSLIPVNTVLSLSLNTLILLVYTHFTAHHRPFRVQRDNVLEIVTTLCCIFVYISAVGMSISGYSYGTLFVEALYIIVNICVIVWCLLEYGRNYLSVFVAYYKHTFRSKNSVGTLDNLGQ